MLLALLILTLINTAVLVFLFFLISENENIHAKWRMEVSSLLDNILVKVRGF